MTLKVSENVASVTIWYPRTPKELRGMNFFDTVEVDLCDVRAADSIRINYDFDRDGWVIKQASTFTGETADFDSDWQEVAFVKAWAREKKESSS